MWFAEVLKYANIKISVSTTDWLKMNKQPDTRQELITTKLFAPLPATTLVPRPRLLQALEEGLQGKLILLSAPAGFGKTTLLAEWIDTESLPFCWVSLDAQDNNPSRFLSYLFASLDSIGIQLPIPDLKSSQLQGSGDLISFLGPLFQKVVENGREFCLVLDDYHLIQREEIHNLVESLLDNLPPAMHLVIATRSDPPLRLAQRRARCELCEIRAEDLRFTLEEAVQFFNQGMGIDLSLEDVTRMEQKTEGWITGLQLAAISLAKHPNRKAFIDAFAGNDRFVADYLLEEALNSQPQDIQEFLLKTSILDRLNASLCNAVTGRSDSALLLEKLERSNLFLESLDNQRTWYRYHQLFSDLLRHHVQLSLAEVESELHLKASEWYRQHGLLADAINHAIAADNIKRVEELTEALAVFEMNESDLHTLMDWLDILPEDAFHIYPWLLVARAWVSFNGGDYNDVEKRLAHLDEILAEGQFEAELTERICGNASALRSYLAEIRDDPHEALCLAQESLDCLPEGDVKLRAFVTIRLANCLSWLGEYERAIPAYEQAGIQAKQIGDGQMAITAFSEAAVMQMMIGKLNKAFESIGDVESYAHTLALKDGRQLPAMGILYRHKSNICLERNLLNEAEANARKAVEICTQWGEQESQMLARFYLAMSLFWQNRRQEAEQELSRSIALAERISAAVSNSVADARQYFQLLGGEIPAVENWVNEQGLDPADKVEYNQRNRYFIYARFLLVKGRLGDALLVTDKLLEESEETGAVLYVIRYAVLKAIILQELKREGEAMQAMKTALDLASPEGYIRSFLDFGTAAAPLLYQAAQNGIQGSFCQQLLDQFPVEEAQKPLPEGVEKLVEDLSKREIEVLALIARGCSNQEIAVELVLSLYTVKSHARSIFSKLGVRNRTEAVARARLLGLLPQEQ